MEAPPKTYPTPAQWQTLCDSHRHLQEELAARQQEVARLIEDKTLLQFLRVEQDQERQRIAQDLHDHLLQNLAALLMQWETAAEKPKQLESRLTLDIRAFSCGKPHSPAANDLLAQLKETAALVDAQVTLESLPDSLQLHLDLPIGTWNLPRKKSSSIPAVVPERPAGRL